MRKLIVMLALGFCSVLCAAEMDSWSEGVKSWEAGPEATVDVVELQFANGGGGNRPTTQRALRITVPDGSWRSAAMTPGVTEVVPRYRTLEIDLLVPPDALPSGTGAFAGLDITVRGPVSKGNAKPFRVQKRLKLDITAKEWREYHFTWTFADEEAFPKQTAAAQVIINTQSAGSVPWTLYVTKVTLVK